MFKHIRRLTIFSRYSRFKDTSLRDTTNQIHLGIQLESVFRSICIIIYFVQQPFLTDFVKKGLTNFDDNDDIDLLISKFEWIIPNKFLS